MESIIGLILFVFVVIWALRLETNTTKTREILERIEKQLEAMNKKEK